MIGIGISPSLLGRDVDVGGYPLDSYSGLRAVFSIRRLLTSYTGDLIRLRRSSDDAESDFGFDANGDLDAAAITTWLGGASGFVVTWYDQSGNGYDASQTDLDADQPGYLASGINSKPVIRNNPAGSADLLVIPDEFTRSLSAGTIFTVAELREGISAAQALWGLYDLDNLEYGIYMRLDATAGKVLFHFGNTGANRSSDTFTLSDPHIFVGIGVNGAPGSIYVDGTETGYDSGKHANGTTTLASYTRDGAVGQLDDTKHSHDSDYDFAELILFDSALSDAERSAIETDQSTYFDI